MYCIQPPGAVQSNISVYFPTHSYRWCLQPSHRHEWRYAGICWYLRKPVFEVLHLYTCTGLSKYQCIPTSSLSCLCGSCMQHLSLLGDEYIQTYIVQIVQPQAGTCLSPKTIRCLAVQCGRGVSTTRLDRITNTVTDKSVNKYVFKLCIWLFAWSSALQISSDKRNKAKQFPPQKKHIKSIQKLLINP